MTRVSQVILVSYLNLSSILSIIKSEFKKFPDRHLYLLLLLIPLLVFAYHSINGLAVAPAYNNQSVLNLDLESGRNQPIFGSDFESGRNQPIFGSDFERQHVTISRASSHFPSFIDNESSSVSTTRPISGNSSLRVDVRPFNTTNWNIISTDFIPVNENAHYNTSLYISAKDVIQLHSKILYFDSNKKEIKSPFISDGRNGTFLAPYNIVDSSPNGTKYMKLEILSRSSPKMPGSYLIDNVKIEKVPLGQLGFTNDNKDILTTSTETNKSLGNQSSEPLSPEKNNPPAAFNQSVSVEQDGQIGINLFANDKENDHFRFDITADPAKGSLDDFDQEKGILTYFPPQEYSGNDMFKFRVVDDKGSESNIALVNINIK